MKNVALIIFSLMIFSSCDLIDKIDADNFNDFGDLVVFEIENTSGNKISELKVSLTNDEKFIYQYSGTLSSQKKF